jgi:undecaprenyl-phosphate 4-deoxy-4-formamido-L-arabinose transferase
MTTVSVAIPCYKSSLTLPTVVADIRKAIGQRPDYNYQIILVNDSPDDQATCQAIAQLCQEDKNIVGIDLSRNFGQSFAKMAAIPYVTGDVLVYMDDDGQHPADQIYRLVDKIFEGYDLVFAHFPHKKHSLFKRFTSWLNSKVLELNGSKPRNVFMSSYYAISRTAVNALKKYKSPFPSMGGYLSHVVQRYANVDMEHRERLAGHSNYTLRKMLRLWLTGFTNFSTVPLRFSAFLGVFCAMIGFLSGVIIIIRKLLDPSIAAGYTSSIAVQLFIGGVIMMILGLCGEYIGRIYMTVSNMPQYEIRQTINVNTEKERLADHEQ